MVSVNPMSTPEPPPSAPVPRRVVNDAAAADGLDLDGAGDAAWNAVRATVTAEDDDDDEDAVMQQTSSTSMEAAMRAERAATARELAATRRYARELELELSASERARAEAATANDSRARDEIERLRAREREVERREIALVEAEERLAERERNAEDVEALETQMRKRMVTLEDRERVMRLARDDLESKDDRLTESIVAVEREAEAVRGERAAVDARRAEIVRELTDREVSVLKREERVTAREHEIRVSESRLSSLKERASEEESRLKRAMERADSAEKRESDVRRRLEELETEEQRVKTQLRETQSDVSRATDSKSTLQRELDAMRKDGESLRDEIDSLIAEKTRQQRFVEKMRSDLDDRERETADAAETAARECESIAIAWEEVEMMRKDLERQEKMIEETAIRLEENVKAYDADASRLREREDANELRSRELRDQEEFIDRAARENDARATDLQTRARELEAREAEVAEWRPKIEDFKSKQGELEAHSAAIEDARKQLDELIARERELEEKELQLEQREEAAARQLSAAAEAEMILNEENARLDDKLRSNAPALVASELEVEVATLKVELERAKSQANAALASADIERRRRAEAEEGEDRETAASSRELVEESLETRTAALLRANALLDERESEMEKREAQIVAELDRIESDTLRLVSLQEDLNEKMRVAVELGVVGSGVVGVDGNAAEERRKAYEIRSEAEQIRLTAKAHLEAAMASAEAARAVHSACESHEKTSAETMSRVSSIVATAIQVAQREGEALNERRRQLESSRADAYEEEEQRKMDVLDAQLEYVERAKSKLDKREAAMRSVAHAKASHRRAIEAVTRGSSENIASRARTSRLLEETRVAAARLRDYLEQGESRLTRAASALSPADVASLRLKLAGLVGVARRVEEAAAEDERITPGLDDDAFGDIRDVDAVNRRLADRLAALEHEIRRAARWFEDLRELVRVARTRGDGSL
jgi:chromosome segregation ATPase